MARSGLAALCVVITGITGGCSTSSAGRSQVTAAGLESVPSSSASTQGCAGSPVDAQPVPAGQKATHTAAEAEAVWKNAHVGPSSLTSITLIWAVDPVAIKLGLASPDQPRLLWQIVGTRIYEPPSHVGPPPDPKLTPGEVLRSSTLVDDATLRLAGNFACR